MASLLQIAPGDARLSGAVVSRQPLSSQGGRRCRPRMRPAPESARRRAVLVPAALVICLSLPEPAGGAPRRLQGCTGSGCFSDACTAGSYWGATCEQCAVGKHDHDSDGAAVSGATPCVDCAAGRIAAAPGKAGPCDECERGRFSNASSGHDQCFECAAGTFAGRGAANCTPGFGALLVPFVAARFQFQCSRDCPVGGCSFEDDMNNDGLLDPPTGYRAGCPGDRVPSNVTASGWVETDCPNEIVCNSSAAEGDRGPNGEDCSWTGAMCDDGWEGVVSLSCGTPPASAPFPAPASSVAGVPTTVQLLCRLQRDDQRDDSW